MLLKPLRMQWVRFESGNIEGSGTPGDRRTGEVSLFLMFILYVVGMAVGIAVLLLVL